MSTIANVQSRIAGLADDSQQVISGVAVGAGDITRGLSGDRKVWRAADLRDAARTLEGVPVKALHSQTAVGEVVRAGFDADRGVIYEAELEDSKLAERIADGGLEVSVEARHADGGTVEAGGEEAMAATDIRFEGLAIVQHGAAPSASASPGEAAALSAAAIHDRLERACLVEVNGEEIDLTPPERVVNAVEAGFAAKEEYDAIADCGTGVGEAMGAAIRDGELTADIILDGGDIADNGGPVTYLSSHAEDAPDTPPTEWDEATWTDGCGPVQDALWGHYLEWFEDKQAEIEAAMEGEQAASAAGVSWDGTADGDLDESALDKDEHDLGDHYLYGSGEDKEDYSYPVVDAEGRLRRGNVDAAWGLGCRGQCDDADAHRERLLTLADAFENPPEWAQEANSAHMSEHDMEDADMAEVPDAYVFDNPGEAVEQAQDMGLEGAGDEIIHTHGEGDGTVFMPASSHEDLMQMLREMDELAADAEFAEGDLVRWQTQASPGTGRVAEVVTEPGESVTSQADVENPPTREATEEEAVYLLDDWDGEAYVSGQVVKSESEMIGAWEDAPEEARMAAGGTDDPTTGEVSPGGEPAERTEQQTTDSLTAHMSDQEEQLRAKLNEKDERIAELESEVEQYEAEREEVAHAYAAALAAGDTVFDEDDLVEMCSVGELRERYNDTESATLADADPAVQSGGGDGQTASLSEDEREEARELRSRLSDLAESSTRLAEVEREQAAARLADITGEDPDTILEQEA